MADLNVILSEIELKLRKVISYNNQLIDENSKLVQRNEELQATVDNLQSENTELCEKLKKIVIVNALGNEKEIEESRQLIKALVKEIDQCVSILNAEQ